MKGGRPYTTDIVEGLTYPKMVRNLQREEKK